MQALSQLSYGPIIQTGLGSGPAFVKALFCFDQRAGS
jgi:hypothetical protein